MPQEVAVTRKDDSLDTVANRFVKFALKKFNLICRELCSSLDAAKEKCRTEYVYGVLSGGFRNSKNY